MEIMERLFCITINLTFFGWESIKGKNIRLELGGIVLETMNELGSWYQKLHRQYWWAWIGVPYSIPLLFDRTCTHKIFCKTIPKLSNSMIETAE
jgi:hypothetical protein